MIYKFSKSKVVVATLLLLSTMMLNKTSATSSSDEQDINLNQNQDKNANKPKYLQARKYLCNLSFIGVLGSTGALCLAEKKHDSWLRIVGATGLSIFMALDIAIPWPTNELFAKLLAKDKKMEKQHNTSYKLGWIVCAQSFLNIAMWVIYEYQRSTYNKHAQAITNYLRVSSIGALFYYGWRYYLWTQFCKNHLAKTDQGSDNGILL